MSGIVMYLIYFIYYPLMYFLSSQCDGFHFLESSFVITQTKS